MEVPDLAELLSEIDGEGASSPRLRLPQSISDEDEDGRAGTRKQSLRAQSPISPPKLHLEEESDEILEVEDKSPQSENAPPRERVRTEPKIEHVSWANSDPIPSKKLPPLVGITGAGSPQRRISSVGEVSHHALDRLGVNADILKKEKGMKKLGICDVDIVRSEELRRYTGISQHAPHSKVEFMFGFTDEQLHRDKAIKRLGTTEQEIMDDYSRRVSRLGVTNPLQL
ncbi:hypothetical protein PHYBOEH_009648 [Phytophthora boehmeriae]|uniref:Uncharacterized protein n=1 Tax=Phytophthora boehmeriae TaxID=109152 RepID=A0A8T1VSF6_9STRA|nr:hypothetical protein PHYBOEH_009648 [Phytophthora boehmeriae]